MAEKTLTADQEKAHVEAQREAARQTLAAQGLDEQRHLDAHINSEATVDSHAGLAPEDTPKPKSMEALKTDLASVTGAPDVHRAPLKTDGVTTDQVTVSPKGAQPASGNPPPESHLAKAAAAAKAGEKKGGGKKKGSAKAAK